MRVSGNAANCSLVHVLIAEGDPMLAKKTILTSCLVISMDLQHDN